MISRNVTTESLLQEDSANETADEFNFREYWNIVYHSKWAIIGLTSVVCVLTVVFVFSMTPIYSATATLLVEAQEANVVSIEEVYGVDSSRREYYKTQFQILNSRELLERVARDIDLETYPEFSQKAGVQKSYRDYVPFFPKRGPVTEDERWQNLVVSFQKKVAIAPIRNTQLVRVSFESADPALAALVANAIGEAYIDNNLESKLMQTQRASEWLTGRLDGMREQLETATGNLRAFQETENLVDVSGVATLTEKELDELTRRLVEVRKRAVSVRSQFEAVGSISDGYNEKWETLPGVLKDELSKDLKTEVASAQQVFSEIRQRYGPKHPQFKGANSKLSSALEAYRTQVRNTVLGFDAEYKAALLDQAAIEKSIRESKREILDINRKRSQLSELQREVDTSRQLYDLFFKRFKETNEANFHAANARFIDHAVKPYVPIKPNKKLIVLLAGVFSILLGMSLALLRAMLNNTIQVAGEIEGKLGQSVLGVLPLEKSLKKDAKAGQLFVTPGYNNFAEAVRTIRTGVILAGIQSSQKVIVVTSSIPGEGKTTLSSNLAMSLGQMEKVLYIDADMRRPSVANELGFNRRKIGLAELCAGTAGLDECLEPFEAGSIDVLTSGAVPVNPLELLSSQKFTNLIEGFCQSYDRVVIDSSPIQAVSDAMVLSQMCDALVYVVKSDATPTNVVLNGVQKLVRVNAPIIGVVLNQFDASVVSKYGYYSSYRYGGDYYGYGYAKDTT